jgi:hypothetical protein
MVSAIAHLHPKPAKCPVSLSNLHCKIMKPLNLHRKIHCCFRTAVKQVRVFRTSDGTLLQAMPGLSNEVDSVAISPNNQYQFVTVHF